MADFRREYHLTRPELARLDAPTFGWLLAGLSEHSRFAQAWSDEPKHLYDRADIDRVKALARA